MSKKNEFMKRAIELSIKNMNQGLGGPFGAVVVMNGQIVGEGANNVTTANDPTAHAEVQAIRDACQNLRTFDLSGAEIYTSCEPCPMCLSAIYWARIQKIYYANTRTDAAEIQFDDDLIYSEIPKALHERRIPSERLMSDKAIKAFHEWDSKSDKVRY